MVVHTAWNARIVDSLVQGATKVLEDSGSEVITMTVPGAFELPFACQAFAKKYDAVIAIGVLIRGETSHYEYISSAVSSGLMDVGLKTNIPVIFGVLTCLTEGHALLRSGLPFEDRPSHNHGIDWAFTAIQMAQMNKLANKI